jgi:hypothetical protein
MLVMGKEKKGMEVIMPATQLCYIPFHCTKLCRNVILTSIHFSSDADACAAGEFDEKVVFDCAEKNTCGVRTEFGRTRSYNWELCSNPELKTTVSE